MKHKPENFVPTWWKQSSFIKFINLYKSKKERASFFVGAGLSMQAGLPNWETLLTDVSRQADALLNRADLFSRIEEIVDAKGNSSDSERATEHETNNKFTLFPTAGSILKKAFKDAGMEHHWWDLLDSILNDQSRLAEPSISHDLLAKVAWHRIITTNYDGLIEKAVKASEKPQIEISHPWNDNCFLIESDVDRRYIFKIHGDILDRRSTIVLAEEDYDVLYGGDDKLQFRRTLGSILRASGVILFIGYGHNDNNFRQLYTDAMVRAPKERSFALVPKEETLEGFDKRIAELSREMNIEFITYSKEGDFEELREFLRYLSDPEFYDAKYNASSHARRATVIMIDCGGTIGSAERSEFDDQVQEQTDSAKESQPLKVRTKDSRFHPGLTAFSNRLLGWYQKSYNAGNDLRLDVKWEILPERYQMFSENATPELWNEILSKVETVVFKYFYAPVLLGSETDLPPKYRNPRNDKERDLNRLRSLFEEERSQYSLHFPNEELTERRFISDFKSRYIAGIILLSGTDTLAYLVSALSFGLQHMPCPIIVTGANQPPDKSDRARNLFYAESDAWRNVMTAFYFMQCFGHTLTDAFVCFSDTIHHGVNVRKTPVEMGPYSRNANTSMAGEPFLFRNLYVQSQYMFRLIDGVFCNNYYSGSLIDYYSLVGDQEDEFKDLRHIRHDPLQQRNLTPRMKQDGFSSGVRHVNVTTSFPLIDVAGMVAGKDGLKPMRVILVDGYASGTYPTWEEHTFSTLLYDAYQYSIPIFLISQYGIKATQQPYETKRVKGVEIPVTHLYGVIAETALPLLSLVVNSIEDDEWTRAGLDKGQLLLHRERLVRRKLKDFFEGRPNILTQELQYVADPDKLLEGQQRLEDELAEADKNRVGHFRTRGRISLSGLEKDGFVFISKRDFLLLLNEVVRPFERVGAAPDGFSILSDLGFDVGVPLVQSYSKGKRTARGLKTTFFARPAAERRELLESANSIISEVAELLKETNIATVSVGPIEAFHTDERAEPDLASIPNHFSFTVVVERPGHLDRGDEKYSAVSYSKGDADFFAKLAEGCNDDHLLNLYYAELEADYDQLLQDKWKDRMRNLDWFLLGIFKGVTCGLAQLLRFDEIAIQAGPRSQSGHKRIFRQSAKCTIEAGDEYEFAIRYEYFESFKDQ
jgi:hypothetical protein